jgi:hypothetical protein
MLWIYRHACNIGPMTAHELLLAGILATIIIAASIGGLAARSRGRYGLAAFAFNVAACAWTGAALLRATGGHTIGALITATTALAYLIVAVTFANARTNATSHTQGREELRQQLEAERKGE